MPAEASIGIAMIFFGLIVLYTFIKEPVGAGRKLFGFLLRGAYPAQDGPATWWQRTLRLIVAVALIAVGGYFAYENLR